MNERTKAIISAVIVIVVNVAAVWGLSLDQGTMTNALCGLADLAAMLWAIWKNHNFTKEAAQAQAVLDHLKAESRALKAKEEI